MFSLNNICENENKIEYMSKYVNKIEPNGKQFLTLKYDWPSSKNPPLNEKWFPPVNQMIFYSMKTFYEFLL